MILDKKDIKRLVIYFFYDADGIVDRYVPVMLEEMKKNSSELFVVVNGKLTPDGREIMQKITPKVYVRENVGFDVWAYKEAMEQYGWEKLGEFDEVVLMNHTIMGPLYPFSEMFEEMNKRDLDFWGLTVHYKQEYTPFKVIYGYIPEHIQSHFIVIRQSLMKSLEFKNYWKTRPPIYNYDDAIVNHEAIFTKTFSDKGFKWDKYVDSDDLEDFTDYPLMMCPTRIIKDYKCPIFKRRSFFHMYSDYLENSSGYQGRELMDFLTQEKLYNVDLIYENLIRTCNMADLKTGLVLDYVLPKKYSHKSQSNAKIALVMHLYFEDLVDYCYDYALSMPASSDIIITTDKEIKAKTIEKRFQGENNVWNDVKIIVIENRGRDVSSLLVGAAPYIKNYDYICFAHDKKVTQLSHGIKGYYFSERCFQNILGSKEYVENIIDKFDSEPFLGLLCPSPPHHSDYFPTISYEWGPNYDVTKEVYDKLKLKSPISHDKEPVAPLGTMFWFRTDAMKKIFEKRWKYSDFPKEPNNTDGTLLHGIERIYPFVVQDAGYYCAWCMNDEYVQSEWSNLHYMLRNINMRLMALYGPNSFNGTVGRLEYTLYAPKQDQEITNYNGEKPPMYSNDVQPLTGRRYKRKQKVKKLVPKPIWEFLRKVYHKFGGKKYVG